jgi:hypothetical protein
MRFFFTLGLATLFLAACSSSNVLNGSPVTPPTQKPSDLTCGPAAGNVMYLEPSDLADPEGATMQRALMRLHAHDFIVLCGANASDLASDLDLDGVGSIAADEASTTIKTKKGKPGAGEPIVSAGNHPSPRTAVAFYLTHAGVVNEFDAFIEDSADESRALTDWIQNERAGSVLSGPVVGSGWQSAYTITAASEQFYCLSRSSFVNTKIFDPCENTQQITFGYWRLNDINANHDWYMVTENLQGKPQWSDEGCRPAIYFGGWNWWSNSSRLVTVEPVKPPAGTFLYANGPPTTESSGSVSYTIGASLGSDLLPGISGDFSASWSQPHVTIANQSAGALSKQAITFEPPGITCSPVLTTISSMSSQHSAMYQVPQKSSLEITGKTSVVKYAFGTIADNHEPFKTVEEFVNNAFVPSFTFTPPVFEAAPRTMVLTDAHLIGKLHITARTGPSNLGWKITNAPGWIVLGAASGTGDSVVTVEAQKGTAPGSIANLNVNTSPGAGANNVETGPLIVRIEKK